MKKCLFRLFLLILSLVFCNCLVDHADDKSNSQNINNAPFRFNNPIMGCWTKNPKPAYPDHCKEWCFDYTGEYYSIQSADTSLSEVLEEFGHFNVDQGLNTFMTSSKYCSSGNCDTLPKTLEIRFAVLQDTLKYYDDNQTDRFATLFFIKSTEETHCKPHWNFIKKPDYWTISNDFL